MKKLISFTMALILCLSPSTALAAQPEKDQEEIAAIDTVTNNLLAEELTDIDVPEQPAVTASEIDVELSEFSEENACVEIDNTQSNDDTVTASKPGEADITISEPEDQLITEMKFVPLPEVKTTVIKQPVFEPFELANGKVILTWNSEHADIFQLQQKSGKTWITIYSGKQNSIELDDLTPAASYRFRVRCSDEFGIIWSDWSKTQTVCFYNSPKTLTASNTASGIYLTWPKIKGVTYYCVVCNGKTLTTTKNPNYTHKKAVPGSEYTYTVHCVDAKGSANSERSPEAHITSLTQPTFTLRNTNGGILINWDKIPGAQQYQIYRKTGKTWPIEPLVTTDISYFTDADAISNGKKYTYRLCAIADDGSVSAYSAAKSSTFFAAPEAVKANNTSKGIKLTWKKVPGCDYYQILRDGIVVKKAVNSNVYTDTAAKSGQIYTYSVLCASSKGTQLSGESEAIQCMYIATPQFTAIRCAADSVVLEWSEVPGAVTYRLYRKSGKTKAMEMIHESSNTKYIDYTATKLKTKYTYHLCAIDENGYESAVSTDKTITYLPIIACIGDSITYGSGVSDRQTESYPAQLQNALGSNVQVKNYGVRGYTVQSNTNKPYIASAAYRKSISDGPAFYIVMLGTNDTKPINWNAANYEKELEEFLRVYIDLVGTENVVVMKPPKIFNTNQSASNPTKHCESNLLQVCSIIERVANKLGLRIIDLHTLTESHAQWFSDGVHPNKAGYKQISKTIVSVIRERNLEFL